MGIRLLRLLRVAIVGTLILLVLSACDSGPRAGLGPGDSPPELELTDLTGSPVTLKNFAGKVLLLNFWASWCAPCIDEMPELERLYQALKNEGFVVVAIGVEDTAEELAKIQQRLKLSFPILLDKEGNAKSRYRLAGFPESFFVNRSGQIVMAIDPSDNSPVVRVIGPREWSKEPAMNQLRAILASGK